jgi:Aminoglycoside-2''-adenylyltransferase
MFRSLPGVDVVRAERQLGLIGEVVEVAAAVGVRVWLRGGWAMDFVLGEITRDHVDIDWFGWARDAGTLRWSARSSALRHRSRSSR